MYVSREKLVKRDQSKCGTAASKEALKLFNYLPSADHALRGLCNGVVSIFNSETVVAAAAT